MQEKQRSFTNSVSCYSTSLLIKYARAKGVYDAVIKGLEKIADILENPREWTTSENWTLLAQNLEIASGNQEGCIAKIAEESFKREVSSFFIILLRIAPLSFLFTHVGSYTRRFSNRNLDVLCSNLDKNGVDVIFKPFYPQLYSPQMCEFNKSWLLSTMKAKGNTNVTIRELKCCPRTGADGCYYRIRWKAKPSFIHQVNNVLFFLFRDQKAIIRHIEENHNLLQAQYKKTKALQEFHSHIMANMEEAVVFCNPRGSVTYANKAFSVLSGRAPDEITGHSFFEYVANASEDNGAILSQCRAHPDQPLTREFNIQAGAGPLRILEVSFQWVEKGESDEGFLIVSRDITQKRQMERKLYLAEDRYRSLYENSPALIVGINLEGRIIYANPAMVEHTGYTIEEILTMSIFDFLAPEGEARQQVAGVFAERMMVPSQLQEVHLRTKAGEWKSFAFNTYPLHDIGGVVAGMAAIGIDVTETKRLNEQIVQTQRMELLGQLAGGLAHDFNNIMTVVSGYGTLISSHTTEPPIRKYADAIAIATTRANEIIRKLLSFSRGNREKVEPLDVNLRDVVSELEPLVRGAVSSSVKIDFALPEASYPLRGDPGALHQVILNICMNAKDALKEKKEMQERPFIAVRMSDAPKEQTVRVEIQDNGPGIPPNLIEKIFDPFFTTKKTTGGTGLGLSVVYGIVKEHGGTVELDSRPGEGTTFTLDFPLRPSGEEGDGDGCARIVLLAPNPEQRALISEVLRHYRYPFVEFCEEEEALQWVCNNPNQTWLVFADTTAPQECETFFSQVYAAAPRATFLWLENPSVPVPSTIESTLTIRPPLTPAEIHHSLKTLQHPVAKPV